MYRSMILSTQVLTQEGINDENKITTLRKQIILILASLSQIDSKYYNWRKKSNGFFYAWKILFRRRMDQKSFHRKNSAWKFT